MRGLVDAMNQVFGAEVIDQANDRWAGTDALWTPVQVLAENLRVAAATGSPPEIKDAWAQLLLAVGNFKRQAPIRLEWVPIRREPSGPRNPAPPSIPWPFGGGSGSIDEDDSGSWELIDGIRGVGVATATTTLAAIWPRSHAVFDYRAHNAAVGLAIAIDGVPPHAARRGVAAENAEALVEDWTAYVWYRDALKLWSNGEDLWRIERTLFELDKGLEAWNKEWRAKNEPVKPGAKPQVPWGPYAKEVHLRAQQGW